MLPGTRGILYGSILGSLFLILFFNDIFLFIKKSDICNFGDGNISCGDDLSVILKSLAHDMKIFLSSI